MPSRVVQYLRVSTDQQEYSIDAQRSAISTYAADRCLEIIDSYLDQGKSGLSLKGRGELQRLLTDVVSPSRSFSSILVFDVSRWGRFQDPDQAAHYEFLCRQAGVEVIYCAEAFQGAGLLAGSVLKSLKRVMAAEYSRELSTKVRAAHMRGARQGFWEGGATPYGLRRELIDEAGNALAVLERGEHKASKVYRCRVVWGPDDEVRTVRRIFALLLKGWPLGHIAEALNARGRRLSSGTSWTPHTVRAALLQPLYTGVQTYNRVNRTLHGQPTANERSNWIEVRVLPPMVSAKVFNEAAARLSGQRRQFAPEQLLDGLRQLWKAEGYLSWELVSRARSVPHPVTYGKYFGKLTNAFAMIGYDRRGVYAVGQKHLTRPQVLKRLKALHFRQGYLSQRTIDKAQGLPSSSAIRASFGSLRAAYAAAGFERTRSEIMVAAYERKRARGPWTSSRAARYPPEAQLLGLRRVLAEHGRIDRHLIASDPILPAYQTVARAFGTLTNAYRLAGAVRVRQGMWASPDGGVEG